MQSRNNATDMTRTRTPRTPRASRTWPCVTFPCGQPLLLLLLQMALFSPPTTTTMATMTSAAFQSNKRTAASAAAATAATGFIHPKAPLSFSFAASKQRNNSNSNSNSNRNSVRLLFSSLNNNNDSSDSSDGIIEPPPTTSVVLNELDQDDEYFDKLFDDITQQKKMSKSKSKGNNANVATTSNTTNDHDDDDHDDDDDDDDTIDTLVDFIEENIGIKKIKTRRGRSKYDDHEGRDRIMTAAFLIERSTTTATATATTSSLMGETNQNNDKGGSSSDKTIMGNEAMPTFTSESVASTMNDNEAKDVSSAIHDNGSSGSSSSTNSIVNDTPTIANPTKKSKQTSSSNANAKQTTDTNPTSATTTNDNDNNNNNIATAATIMEEQPPPSVNEKKGAPYNVVCTHITADFDTLASAIGLAKLWSMGIYDEDHLNLNHGNNSGDDNGNGDDDDNNNDHEERSIVHGPLPTYVVLPRGAHPDVQRFLSLHKHLFPIRSLKSLPGFSDSDLKNNNSNNNSNNNNNNNNGNKDQSKATIANPYQGLQRVGLVDAQRRDRLGPADILLSQAKLGVTIVDHHVDAESDIPEAVNYIVENVGSVSTMISERLRNKKVEMTEAEATILALGIHSDTGSLVYDSTTAKDASMLGWAMEMGASQAAIAEHAKPSLSDEQQGVLTQALINVNSTTIHGVTISTVLLSADGFISGLAAVTKDALDLSSSDVFLLAVCYEATRGNKGGGSGGGGKKGDNAKKTKLSKEAADRLQKVKRSTVKALSSVEAEVPVLNNPPTLLTSAGSRMINSDSWKGGDMAFQRQRLAATFAFHDTDRSGFLERDEIATALRTSGFLISQDNFESIIDSIDTNGDGKIDFEEFVYFYSEMEEQKQEENFRAELEGRLAKNPSTMTIIGRVKAGVNVRNVNLNKLFQQFNGGGHPKAASATTKLEDENEAKVVLDKLVDELIETGLTKQLTVGDFMQSPVLSAKPTMTEKQVEDLFIRYDVRALPVVNDNNEVIGLVSYKEVAAAKMRLMNKQEKRMRQIEKAAQQGKTLPESDRPLESALKGWMKQHVQLAKSSMTMAEAENILLDTDVGCMPVVTDDTNQLIGMVTRTDLLRQHRYYNSLHYHNKGFSDSIAARKPIIELRKKLKKFDIES